MKTNNSLIFIVLLFLSLQTTTKALIINEIMYDPEGSDTDREWIEILNDSNDTVDLTSWKFFEANTNHGLTMFQGGMLISIGGYAVIANNPSKFLLDNPTFQGTLIKASFSLSNSGEYLAMKNQSGAIVDSLTYIPSLGGQDDGTTLSFLGGTWVRGDKTPGATNTISSKSITPPVITTQTTPSVTTNSQSVNEQVFITPATITSSDLAVNTVNEKIVLSGADSEFTARASIAGKKVPENAEFTWSFGDGGTKIGRSVGYHYQYPGIYVATVEVSADGSNATARTKVKVIEPEISITETGGEVGKNYVEIANNSSYEIDISNWKIALNRVYYQIPKNTFIMGKQKVKLSGASLGFASTTISTSTLVQLMYPNYMEMLRYTPTLIPTQVSAQEIKPTPPSFVSNTVSTPTIYKTTYKKPIQDSIKSTTIATTSTTQLGKQVKTMSWFKRFLSKL